MTGVISVSIGKYIKCNQGDLNVFCASLLNKRTVACCCVLNIVLISKHVKCFSILLNSVNLRFKSVFEVKSNLSN